MLSLTARLSMWDVDIDDYAKSEGVTAIVLKRLSQALADGDNVECAIRETGLNQDGKTKGTTMPSANIHTALIQKVYAKAGLGLSRRSDDQSVARAATWCPSAKPIADRLHPKFAPSYGNLKIFSKI